ncbi:hypothetical protein [Bacillus toyonensis]|uniref:hypothetical protein n=1 Tax=Bacillus toyonensis TaxID=155322 RepID=UPI000BEE16B8|nr:hypothetical protein [Bacillus toyonensis]PEB19736.1 hypothetical protein COO08_05340 [Bacillus toyonensis]PHC14365.1 hypothetical protein COF03_24975 [Bacillus toyonensis]PHG31269.1 hypothetical protein COI60_22600 [Bacillus toyonensis]
MSQSVQIYLGVPQTSKLPVYDVKPGIQVTIKQMIVTNTDIVDAKVTMTVNTVDIMKNRIIKAGSTEVIDMFVVLNQSNTLSLQQEKDNAINVMISGTFEPVPTSY